jgi:hypothetical protein
MSTRIKRYIIYGIKFGEEFTEDFWKKDFYDNMSWDKDKPSDEPFFITDGMNGMYTFFGFIQELDNGQYDFEEEITEIRNEYDAYEIIDAFKLLYPDANIVTSDVKMYYLPHYT